jgi:hypothetical protein
VFIGDGLRENKRGGLAAAPDNSSITGASGAAIKIFLFGRQILARRRFIARYQFA